LSEDDFRDNFVRAKNSKYFISFKRSASKLKSTFCSLAFMNRLRFVLWERTGNEPYYSKGSGGKMGRYASPCSRTLQGGQNQGCDEMGAHLDDSCPRGFAERGKGRKPNYADAEEKPFS
jgi:hypothetical protein